jgi:hypothetical protein
MHSQLLAALRPIFNLCSDLDVDTHEGWLPQVYHSAIGGRLRGQMGAAVGRALAGHGGRRGAVGFLAPISNPDARQYWTEVYSEVSQQCRIVLTAVHG